MSDLGALPLTSSGSGDDWETDWEVGLKQLSIQNGEGTDRKPPGIGSVHTQARKGGQSRNSQTASVGTGSAGTQSQRDWQPLQEDEKEEFELLPFGGRHILEVHGLHAGQTDIWLERQATALLAGTPPSVRRLTDTAALLVFADPAAARSALSSSATLSLSSFCKDTFEKQKCSVSDLMPPRPRPRSSPVVARRLIAHALNMSDLPDKEGELALKEERKSKAITKAARAAGLNAAWDD